MELEPNDVSLPLCLFDKTASHSPNIRTHSTLILFVHFSSFAEFDWAMITIKSGLSIQIYVVDHMLCVANKQQIITKKNNCNVITNQHAVKIHNRRKRLWCSNWMPGAVFETSILSIDHHSSFAIESITMKFITIVFAVMLMGCALASAQTTETPSEGNANSTTEPPSNSESRCPPCASTEFCSPPFRRCLPIEG